MDGKNSFSAVFSFPRPWGPAVRLRIQALACGAVRVTRTLRDAFLPDGGDVVISRAPGACEVDETEEKSTVRCGAVTAVIDKKEGSILFRDGAGNTLLREKEKQPCLMEEKPVMLNRFPSNAEAGGENAGNEGVPWEARKAYTCRQGFVFQPGEGLYGLGSHEEGYGNLRGKTREMYQHNMKAVVPVLVSTKGWGLLFDLGCMMVFHDDAEGSYLWADCADEMDYYFMAGGFEGVYAAYRALTGAAPLPPRYAFGYVQSKERYKTGEELLDVVKEYRRRQVPLDVIVQDWMTWPEGQWGYKVFDESRFPEPEKLTNALHALGAKMMISVWPSMVGDKNENRREMLENGCMLGNRTIYNAFDEKARALYWRQARDGLFRYGVDAWWCDCSEPFESDWMGEIKLEPWERARKSTEEAKKYLDPGRIGQYSLYHTMGIYQGQRQTTDEKRVLNLTRSAWAGQHRYGAFTWSGDVCSTWETLRRQVPEGLNFMATGENNWTTDGGGFFPQRDGRAWYTAGDFDGGVDDPGYRELFVRWLQFGAFLPMMRAHGTWTPREIWRFGDKGGKWYDALEKIIRLRSRMVPYLYSLAAAYADTGVPMARVPALAFPEDEALTRIDDQMLLGPSLLVKPVTRPMEYLPEGKQIAHPDYAVSVYLPKGAVWHDWNSEKEYPGGQTVTVPAPLDTVPLFIRAGGILPLCPVRQYVDEIKNPPLEILVFPGADGTFTLYDDAGDGYGYEKGEFARITFSWDDAAGVLTLSTRQGAYPGMTKETDMLLRLRGGKTVSVRFTGQALSAALR